GADRMMLAGCLSLLVTVQDTERYTTLFASITLKCDYSTSAQLQDVVVTWRFKSFCKDPIFDYYSVPYQASLALGQDPSDDCNDVQRKVRIVIQKYGQNEPVLGVDYRQRKITIQNRADLVISEVMWWDHGVYYCTVEAPGDTSGDPDKEVKLIVLLEISIEFPLLGHRTLLLRTGHLVCSPLYSRHSCSKLSSFTVLERHRFMKRAQAFAPWMLPNMFYGGADRNSQLSSYQLNPLLQQDVSLQNSLPLVQPQARLSPNKGVLDYLESEIQNLNPSQPRPPSNQRQAVQPSLLSSLGSDIMQRGTNGLPPLTGHVSSSHGSSNSSRPQRTTRSPRSWDSIAENRREDQRWPLPSSEDSRSSYSREPRDRQREDHPPRQRTGGYDGRPQQSRRDVSPTGQTERGKSSSGSCSFYSEETKEHSSHHRGRRQQPAVRQEYQQHTRNSNNSRHRRHSYSPPSRRGSWSSSEEQIRLPVRNRRWHNRSREWPEDKPPSYRSLEIIPDRDSKHREGAGPRSVSRLPLFFQTQGRDGFWG
uniref:Ig-like domain-containing protein n=1 Tax=Pavo cristatus TaxID=9049 RepID=A0A8C9FHZ1_PAVCR